MLLDKRIKKNGLNEFIDIIHNPIGNCSKNCSQKSIFENSFVTEIYLKT